MICLCLGQESLSVLDLSKDKHFHVKHYRIRRTDQGYYYISSKNVFSSLPDLVEHYRGKSLLYSVSSEERTLLFFVRSKCRRSLLSAHSSMSKDRTNDSCRSAWSPRVGTSSALANGPARSRKLWWSLPRQIWATRRGDQMYENGQQESGLECGQVSWRSEDYARPLA